MKIGCETAGHLGEGETWRGQMTPRESPSTRDDVNYPQEAFTTRTGTEHTDIHHGHPTPDAHTVRAQTSGAHPEG